MASDKEEKYCTVHGREVFTKFDDDMNVYHDTVKFTGEVPQGGTCYGPFAETLPPPPISEEEWDDIFANEHLIEMEAF